MLPTKCCGIAAARIEWLAALVWSRSISEQNPSLSDFECLTFPVLFSAMSIWVVHSYIQLISLNHETNQHLSSCLNSRTVYSPFTVYRRLSQYHLGAARCQKPLHAIGRHLQLQSMQTSAAKLATPMTVFWMFWNINDWWKPATAAITPSTTV